LEDLQKILHHRLYEKTHIYFPKETFGIMSRYNIVYESSEDIYGVVPKAYDRVHYKSILKVKDGGKFPVSLEMTFVPPHPFAFNMPDSHSIKGTSITDVYVKVVRFFNKFGIEFRN
jgi:hypothetical protein